MEDTNSKLPHQSFAIVAPIVSVLIGLATFAGVQISQGDATTIIDSLTKIFEHVQSLIVAVTALVAVGTGIYGRYTATQEVRSYAAPTPPATDEPKTAAPTPPATDEPKTAGHATLLGMVLALGLGLLLSTGCASSSGPELTPSQDAEKAFYAADNAYVAVGKGAIIYLKLPTCRDTQPQPCADLKVVKQIGEIDAKAVVALKGGRAALRLATSTSRDNELAADVVALQNAAYELGKVIAEAQEKK
jgi:hypothetical protein